MGEGTSQIERDIAAERNELGRNLQLLENKARSLADWRTYYRHHPFAMVGLALAGGLMLGALTNTMGEGVEESENREAGPASRASESGYTAPSPWASSAARVRRQFGDTFDHIADALLGVASAKAIEFVSEMVPGFREQFAERHPEHRPFSAGGRNM